ncbi:MAG: SDR family NAD(P)-dependent oxidoreductase [Sphingomonadales bacterium]|nr:SDR family NAD(P)-dependent oxidoreductase [Sphingomonadales bacterium]
MTFREKYGPWALITGASEGVGRAFARRIAAEGVNLVLVARREGPLAELAAELTRDFGVEAVPLSVDLFSTDAPDRIRAAIGRRDIGLYISNAGADPFGARFLDLDLEKWQGLINVNVNNLVAMCHRFGTEMRAKGRGGIIVIGSGACYGGGRFMATYSGAKGFSLNFTESLWSELQPYGVDVLYMALAMTDTPELRRHMAERGQTVPENIASPDDVAAKGLESLGQLHLVNWGQEDDQDGFVSASAAARRGRIGVIDQSTRRVFGD